MSNQKNVTLAARFWANVEITDNCWKWTGRSSGRGYGSISVKGVNRAAHKVSLEIAGRPVPAGMLADHICRNRLCVRPDHLRAATPAQNTLENSNALTAVNKQKTHCPKGHEYTPENTQLRRGRRHCRACQRRWNEATCERRRMAHKTVVALAESTEQKGAA